MGMKLEAQEITFGYRGMKRPILENYSLSIESGEVVGLMGFSGRGKTTLCKLLAGYERPQKGKILLDGATFTEKKGYCPVQMIWQHAIQAVDPRLRMKDILTEGGPVPERIQKGLGIKGEWMDRFPSELSGGELQRFCIARALGEKTRFLLADEMTAMLDLVSQSRIWYFLLQEARERNIGILAVSHNRGLLERICTRIETGKEGKGL